MSEKRYDDDKLFRFHWRGTSRDVEDGYGRDVSDAFGRLGYGGGAMGALDYWEEVQEPAEP
jgi:hypothetical protein